MNAPLITRARHTPPKGQSFIADMQLTRARAHEFCGPARRSLALMLASRMEGPVYWIQSEWDGDRLHGPGMAEFLDPSRVTFIRPKRADDLLWCMEEVLRSGAVPLVFCELPEPPPLTPVRRLHLAAEAGALHGAPPLGVLLTVGDGGAQGVESRWHLAPAHHADRPLWHLSRRRARMAPPASFDITWNGKRAHLAEGQISA